MGAEQGLGQALGETRDAVLPPLSPSCDVPPADLAAPEPLPNVAVKLPHEKTVRILAIGSSASSNIGATPGIKTYSMQLEALLETALKDIDIQIINRGLPGEVAATAAERLKSEVVTEKPDLVLWQVGMNDALSRVDPDDFEQTVRSTISWLQDNHIDVVLVGMQYAPRFVKDAAFLEIRERMRKIAATSNILYVRRYDAMQFIARTRANQPQMMRDEFHLNDLGYQCMAEHVARAVIASLYLKKVRPGSN
ncbi:lipolytic protein G-D-S-L family [Beijerinckia indica subsp. indica ATCC 9039]|uniref:Lipolytic protein G-D-S-L family n=2 Tax=Beijerinckia TaxID=532 RepID=B2IGP8_BEII9|nr:lipolytic protein G-D-S-L family [Beijerinckia indica subsp. indica ATCC 9039]